MLLCIALTSIGLVGSLESDTKVLIEPNVVTVNPGETFWVDVNIEKVTDLYAFEFKIDYVSGTKVIGVIDAEGNRFDPTNYFDPPYFLYGPEEVEFSFFVEPMKGYVHVGCTILGDWPGLSGSGTLAKVQFAAVEAGESDLHLYDVVLLDHNLNPMGCATRDSYVDGVNAELVMINIGARTKDVGDMQTFSVKVNHEDPKGTPLTARARIDNVRDDGFTQTMWAGQSFEFPPIREDEWLYVDGYTVERQQWTEVGTSPFLDAPDDGNEIVGSADGAQHRWFTFEDIALEGAVLDYVQLEVYCEGPATTDVDYDVYAPGFNWLGSWYGTGVGNRIWQDTPRWTGPGHSSDFYPDLMTEEGINGMEALAYYYDPTNIGVGNDIIDSMRLHVVFQSGRAPETAYVSDYDATRQQWTEVGAYPFLDATDDGNYLTCTTDGAQHRWFTLDPIDIGDSVVADVIIEGYTDGPYNEGIDYDVYTGDFDWLGSLYATGEPAWVTPRWTGPVNASDIVPALTTQEGLDNLQLLVYFYDPDGLATGDDVLDAIRLTVYFRAGRVTLPLTPPTLVVQPGEVVYLDLATWKLEPEDVGSWECTITVQYSYFGARFNEATKHVITESWRCRPPE